jgi:outer membrane protein OmpA-like peptidoglycan-associated protein
MKCLFSLAAMVLLLLTGTDMRAQRESPESSADVAFWVAHWAQPRVVSFGPEEAAFNQNMHDIMFPWNDHDEPANPGTLDENVQWLKQHPNARFYIDGYASSRGNLLYNLALSQRRAEWVRTTLISKGIPENQIALAAGWGELYPVCPETNDECWSKNRLVRFFYSPK